MYLRNNIISQKNIIVINLFYLIIDCLEEAKKKTRQRPTLPCRYQHSTIGPDGLNFSVRNG